MTYTKTDTRADFTALEQQILSKWANEDTFHKSLDKTKSGRPF
jgi:isoleucyl-tRNA synthetase